MAATTMLRAGLLLALLAPAAPAAVLKGTANLSVTCSGAPTNLSTDWYFPSPNPNLGYVWLQHGFSRSKDNYEDLAREIAAAGYLVFAPNLSSFGGCSLSTTAFLDNVAALFAAPGGALLTSAQAAASAAGTSLASLPAPFALAGHSAGGNAATYVGSRIVAGHPAAAANLRGLALLDPVENGSTMSTALPALAGVPIRTVSSPPYSCNSNASGTVLLTALARPFVGVRVVSGSHCDAEGDSTNFLCTFTCGSPQAQNVAVLQTLTVGWLADFFSGGFTATNYPSGPYYDGRVAANVISTLPDPSSCGDGTLQAGEQCDDGNRGNGDCCNAICGFEAAGSACAADGNACTDDVCDGSGVCGVDNAAPCSDGVYCNGTDTCAGGACSVHSGDPCSGGAVCADVCNELADSCLVAAGTPCPADGNVCTDDVCSGSGTCGVPNGAPCSDGLYCTGADTCSGGACSVHAGDPCAGGPACADACNEAADSCLVPLGAPCPADGNGCTDDICNGAGACGVNNSAACDDGLFCNGSDACAGGVCGLHAGDPCAGGPTCANACNEAADSCLVAAGTPCPADGNVCTDDVCTGAGACGVANTAPCDDGQFCNGPDTCAGGACATHAGDPCSGGGECADVCGEAGDSCLAPAGTACSDDGNVCTDDACDGAGTCAHAANAAPCSDGNACTAGDGCAAGACVAGAPLTCSTCEVCDSGLGCVGSPRTGCIVPVAAGGAKLLVKDRSSATGDKLVWRWGKGGLVTAGDLGAPTATDDYTLCVFDESTTSPALLFKATAPAGAKWTAAASSVTFRDAIGASDGLVKVRVTTGAAGKAKALVLGRGASLALPGSPALPLPLRVQLQSEAGACWEAAFATAARNSAGTFKARSD